LIPFLIVAKISLSEFVIGVPPFKPILKWVGSNLPQIHFNFGNYAYLIYDDFYLVAYLSSLKLAFIATILCLIIGYPMAYAIYRSSVRWRTLLLLLIVLPFWTSFLIRVYAWIGLLSPQGLINSTLMTIGLIEDPLPLLYNDFSVCLGLVYCYLPFMILPIYVALDRLDPTLFEASHDLGATPFQTFLKIISPLTLPGIIAGSLLVFIPAIGEFVIPDLLGGSDTLMIGKVIWTEFFINRDWPVAAALAITMLLIIVVPIMLFQKFKSQESRS
ncbi:MAG: ABC transporter permease subunit, partial [Alphaproteobacteria bacterium]|nr:ABC transporter permease subunit [Alphaproteobacteria bacterium]